MGFFDHLFKRLFDKGQTRPPSWPFSGGEDLNARVGYLMARVRHIAQDEGFAVNEKNSRRNWKPCSPGDDER